MGHNHGPVVFDEFFQLGLHDQASPFLHRKAKKWAKNLSLKAAILSAFFLLLSFALLFLPGYGAVSSLLLVQVYFLAGTPSLINSLEDIGRFEINIDVLMTLAAFSSILIGSPMEGGLLLVLFALSESMGEAVEGKAKGAIQELYKISPSRALVIEKDGSYHERSVQDVVVGAKILIRAGETVPLDGLVIKGASSLNLVHLTGESLPVTKEVGDEVAAGAQNLDGTLTVEVVKTSSDSTISRIIALVTKAQEAKPRLQRWFDRLSKGYAITIITLSGVFAAIFPYLFGIPLLGMEGSLYRALAFLIAASPCALIIATPIAYLSAVSTCAKRGILLKGGIILDALASCRAIAFDKTGTLTTGELCFLGVKKIGKDEGDEKLALQVATTLERHAVHPIAQAVLDYAKVKGALPLSIESFQNIPGHGVEAIVDLPMKGKKKCVMGKGSFILEMVESVHVEELEEELKNARREGALASLLLIEKEVFLFTFEDSIRPYMKETVSSLEEKWNLSMLTGDHSENAKRVAQEVGIHEVFSDLKPEDKLRHVGALADKWGLAMIGDGINDAPALARATVGISLGKVGSQTAVEAADVVLLHDDLEQLPWLMEKARMTQKIVRQNLFLAAGVILIATTPALLGWVPLWAAVVLHEGGTVIVGLNALRLLR